MRRATLPLLGLAGLLIAGCASTSTPDGDVATYDSLRLLRGQCIARGMELVLKPGGNERRLSGYECKGR
ncbi:hypothetical protein [Phenylobacterium sp.]|jgi:hypothetical protein|uniref:hypothetical protein n=1 Tax=Phenylobacterium sp. TaxID=1871053 RepID=UPI0025EFE779|nr:hypothetical protein [Phenylobacterium sp.]MCA3721613.1 hypothetical protein [Phenylobacterium sp.]